MTFLRALEASCAASEDESSEVTAGSCAVREEHEKTSITIRARAQRARIAGRNLALLGSLTDGAPLPARSRRPLTRAARARRRCANECNYWSRCACGRAEC